MKIKVKSGESSFLDTPILILSILSVLVNTGFGVFGVLFAVRGALAAITLAPLNSVWGYTLRACACFLLCYCMELEVKSERSKVFER